ncbi:zinc ribbon domain-containing protein [uncultured Ruminococcus sp.]|uniref:zinc ribbon domain-containing protein n=1 Tax=uncultured Ruminococcus sp. TaxID=165186 RepID=UPI002636457E|nr:zinc ribbon domain-containing protein [uncultured Ruminococcus sp.]
MICNKCGSEMPDDALFCTECGASLKKEEVREPFVDSEPTSILPHLEEVIADNEEALGLSQEQAQLLSDEPAEILGKTETVVIPEPEPVPPAENSFDKPVPFPKEEKPVKPPVNGAPDVLNDNSSTMKIPLPNEPYSSYNVHTNQFAGNGNAPRMNGSVTPPVPPVIPQQAPVPPVREPEPAPMPAPMPAQTEAKPKAKAKVGGGRIFAASLVTIFTMIMLLLVSLLTAVKVGANGDIIRKRASKLNAETALSAQFDGKEMSKTLYDSLGFRTATKGAADEAGFRRFMLSSDFREYSGDVLKGYLDYIIDGEGSDPSITAEDFVNDFIKGNKSAAQKEFSYELTDDDYDLMQKNLEKDKFSDSMSVKEWGRKIGFDVDKLSYGFSYITIGILGGLFLLFLIWIAAIVRRRARHVTGFFGTIFTGVGFIVFFSGLAIILGSAVAFTFTHNACFYLAESLLLPFSVILLVIGAAELFIGFCFRKTKKGLKKKERKTSAAVTTAQ